MFQIVFVGYEVGSRVDNHLVQLFYCLAGYQVHYAEAFDLIPPEFYADRYLFVGQVYFNNVTPDPEITRRNFWRSIS